MKKGLVIAIDGPAGAGKTSISKAAAKRLGYTYIDTGALYRGFALKAKNLGIDIQNDDELSDMCNNINLSFQDVGGERRLFLDGVDVSKEIREPDMSMRASDISARPIVRAALLGTQRDLGRDGAVILEGRDIGTVVFPDADIKFYLDAAVDERAKRRLNDYQAAGKSVSLNDLVEEIKQRDQNDSTREHAPLTRTDDAIHIDSTKFSFDEVLDIILDRVHKLLEL